MAKEKIISISKESGKMQGIPSLNTSRYDNKNCLRLEKIDGTICQYCLAVKVENFRKQTRECYHKNTLVLTSRILTWNEIEEICLRENLLNAILFRFESFGDLNNETQLINYVNIALYCKYTKFALFTKHYIILLNYFKKGFKLPKNIRLVLSSPFMDKELNTMFVNKIKSYHKDTITFTVTKDKKNPNINCGKRQCITCRNCYDSKDPHNVVELIK